MQLVTQIGAGTLNGLSYIGSLASLGGHHEWLRRGQAKQVLSAHCSERPNYRRGSSAYPVALLLGPITTSHLYRDDRIVYTSNGEAMGTYEYARWAEPPSEMIRDLLVRELRSSHRYQHVYSLQSDVRGDYPLREHLYDLCEISGNGLAARVSVEFELRDSKTGATVWTGSYTHDEPSPGRMCRQW